MILRKKLLFIFTSILALLLFGSCNKQFKSDDYTAYFGGEVSNPLSRYVLLYKDAELIDTLKLDAENRFFKKYDSLAPGMYTFSHRPEYQYVYFEKNDSLLVAINSQDFDNSIVFTGRGDQKNNFLMEMYLRNDKDRESIFLSYDKDLKEFNAEIESAQRKNDKFYKEKKEELKWSDDFDQFAKAALEFPYYSKKELYPIVHNIRTGNDVVEELPDNYYGYRKSIDFNNPKLSNFSPFVNYLSHMLNNMATINYHNHFTQADLSLKTNTNKLDIADTLIKNEKVKNTVLNNIAFTYLLEDQNMVNNQKFLDAYHKYSSDRSQKNEITKIGNAIVLLKEGNQLPAVKLEMKDGKIVNSDSIIKGKSVIFFWTDKAKTHFIEVHKKVLQLQKKYPDYQFIAVNLDEEHKKWVKTLDSYKLGNISLFQCNNFEDLKMKWAITKIHRTIVLNADGTIKNAFTNLFDNDFEQNLKN